MGLGVKDFSVNQPPLDERQRSTAKYLIEQQRGGQPFEKTDCKGSYGDPGPCGNDRKRTVPYIVTTPAVLGGTCPPPISQDCLTPDDVESELRTRAASMFPPIPGESQETRKNREDQAARDGEYWRRRISGVDADDVVVAQVRARISDEAKAEEAQARAEVAQVRAAEAVEVADVARARAAEATPPGSSPPPPGPSTSPSSTSIWIWYLVGGLGLVIVIAILLVFLKKPPPPVV